MNKESILDLISRGRTDLVFNLLGLPDWKGALNEGPHKLIQWLVHSSLFR